MTIDVYVKPIVPVREITVNVVFPTKEEARVSDIRRLLSRLCMEDNPSISQRLKIFKLKKELLILSKTHPQAFI